MPSSSAPASSSIPWTLILLSSGLAAGVGAVVGPIVHRAAAGVSTRVRPNRPRRR